MNFKILLWLITPIISVELTDCHAHDATQYCLLDGVEGYVSPSPATLVSSYTDCHSHETDLYCLNGGEEVLFVTEVPTEDEAGHGSEGHEHEEGEHEGSEHEGHEHSESEESGQECHFHAGVEHCVSHGSSNKEAATCQREDRDYNIPLRIGLVFAMLATSALGSFSPIIVNKIFNTGENLVVSILKQFGTGIVISTAFVHLYTHASLMFNNECLSGLDYESTTAAIVMAGLFIAFLIEYICNRLINHRKHKLTITNDDEEVKEDESLASSRGLLHENDGLSVILLEMGMIFHSVLLGITLVVAGDSFFITLFIVIVFHQFFEGVALGSRISTLMVSFIWKLAMAFAFAITTSVGMAIGIGVLKHFNGNDPLTLIALGTLDAFSAGILIWIGIIEMWAHDWIFGPLAKSSLWTTIINLVALVAGFILMSVLGKWA